MKSRRLIARPEAQDTRHRTHLRSRQRVKSLLSAASACPLGSEADMQQYMPAKGQKRLTRRSKVSAYSIINS
jgi:hypothetical protein